MPNMSKANVQQRQVVMAAIRDASAPFVSQQATTEVVQKLSSAVFNALYSLAMKGVIPPELKLEPGVSAGPDGQAVVDLSGDLRAWLNE